MYEIILVGSLLITVIVGFLFANELDGYINKKQKNTKNRNKSQKK